MPDAPGAGDIRPCHSASSLLGGDAGVIGRAGDGRTAVAIARPLVVPGTRAADSSAKSPRQRDGEASQRPMPSADRFRTIAPATGCAGSDQGPAAPLLRSVRAA